MALAVHWFTAIQKSKPVSMLTNLVVPSTTVSLVIHEGHPHLPSALPQSSFTHFAARVFRRSLSYQGLGPPHDITRPHPLIGLLGSREASLVDLTGA